ncbi:MAG: M16 family metallopeptidase [Pyrinomonadaceae bacterium]
MPQIINKFINYGSTALIALLLAAGLPSGADAQNISPPDRQHLLNGLTILYGNRAGEANVLVKLRVHSGAVFDPGGKAGTMSILADALFPESTTGEYVAEQLGGHLEVVTNYDSINVSISGQASELERMIELVRNAILNVNLSAESVTGLREARLKQLSEKQFAISDIANRLIAARLFGSFPYGSPAEGTVETVTKIDRADLMLARERFLNADNATLVVIGGVDKARVMRAARQLLGSWQKGDRIVPATFRQPAAVDNRVLIVDQNGARNAEIRIAVRGLARSDREATAASVLAAIIKQRWQSADNEISSPIVVHEAHALNGMFMLGGNVPTSSAVKAISTAQAVMHAVAKEDPSLNELDTARKNILMKLAALSPFEFLADAWLDGEAYKIPANNPADELNRISPGDVRRVAARLFEDAAPQAIIVLGNAAALKSQFDASAEVRTDQPQVKPSGSARPRRP